MPSNWDIGQANEHAYRRLVISPLGYSSFWQWVRSNLPRWSR